MNNISLLKDASFLRELDKENLKVYYVKIIVLDSNEHPLSSIEGRVSSGSLSIDGSSSIRRAGNISFISEEKENDLNEIENMLSMNKKIKILIGIENKINKNYDDIIWFNQGIFVITQPSISHSNSGVNINLSFKDKMCLLNGECGGNLPTSITFHEYDQLIGYEEIEYISSIVYPYAPNENVVYGFKEQSTGNYTYMMYDATNGWDTCSETLVGTTYVKKQRIFDIIQTLVCNYGGESIGNILINDIDLELKSSVRYIGSDSLYHNTSNNAYSFEEQSSSEWEVFNYNEDCGYVYTDFVYPGTLISSIGDNICTILDKIKSTLGNYEYFYDIEGRFVFQEIKNYLNTSYGPIQKLDYNGFLLNNDNYFVDFSNISKSVYTFEEGSNLINSYTNTPNYTNIKNDFHIWGKNEDGYAIHYHLVIKDKPDKMTTRKVVDVIEDNKYTGQIKLANENDENAYDYTPEDWRAELYLQGLEKKKLQQRPDIYQQELLDLFDNIYDMRNKEFKADVVNRPNDLNYWFDYLLPLGELHDISVDAIGTKIYSYQQDKINKLYEREIPNVILINMGNSVISRASLINKCKNAGQSYSNVYSDIYNAVAIGTSGYSAQDTARQLLYQYTDYNAAISVTSIPIYYLDVNTRITMSDRASEIYGDYIIKSISYSLNGQGTMNITATRALERV